MVSETDKPTIQKWCIWVHYTSGAREKLVYNKSTSHSLAVAYKELKRLSKELKLYQWEGIADFSVGQC
jgi:hypothetical protein